MKNEKDEYKEALLLSRSDPPNFQDAYALLKVALEKGDDRAIYAIATWYLFGNEVLAKDESKGISILESLSDSFVAEAVFDLAICYDYGRLVEKDSNKAFSLYMKAALLGDTSSCDQISQFYAEGNLVEHNDDLSKAWKKRSEQEEKDISPSYRLWLVD